MRSRKYIQRVCLLFLLCCHAVPAVAADASLTIASPSAPAGAAVAVPLEIDPAGNALAVLVIRLQLDLLPLSLVGVEAGALISGKTLSHHLDTAGVLTIVVYGGPAITEAGEVARVVFDTLAGPGTQIPLEDVGSNASDAGAEDVALGVTPGAITLTENTGHHDADFDGNWRIELDELLRAADFFEAGAYHCMAGTEDGFAPGDGDQDCAPHTGDHAPQDWRIGIGELLRMVQLHNVSGGRYHIEPESEDGFAPGPFM